MKKKLLFHLKHFKCVKKINLWNQICKKKKKKNNNVFTKNALSTKGVSAIKSIFVTNSA